MTTPTVTRTPLQIASALVGGVFVLVGILGFVPGVTSNFDELAFAGTDSDAELLGLFEVSVLHNVVHLLLGVVGLAAARSFQGSKVFLVGGGLLYLGLWLYGLMVEPSSGANFVPLNAADNWLHLGLGAGMVVVGMALAYETREEPDRGARRVGATGRTATG